MKYNITLLLLSVIFLTPESANSPDNTNPTLLVVPQSLPTPV